MKLEILFKTIFCSAIIKMTEYDIQTNVIISSEELIKTY